MNELVESGAESDDFEMRRIRTEEIENSEENDDGKSRKKNLPRMK